MSHWSQSFICFATCQVVASQCSTRVNETVASDDPRLFGRGACGPVLSCSLDENPPHTVLLKLWRRSIVTLFTNNAGATADRQGCKNCPDNSCHLCPSLLSPNNKPADPPERRGTLELFGMQVVCATDDVTGGRFLANIKCDVAPNENLIDLSCHDDSTMLCCQNRNMTGTSRTSWLLSMSTTRRKIGCQH